MSDRTSEEPDLDIAGRDDQTFKLVMSQYGGPAYLRRAQQVAAAFEDCLSRCRKQRDEWLTMVRIRLGMLHALTGRNTNLNWCADEQTRQALAELHGLLEPHACPSIEPTSSARVKNQALCELGDSVQRFNERWRRFIEGYDLADINKQRENYNRYYVLEKECITRSPRLARQGFSPLKPLTTGDLFAQFPLLPTFEV